MSIILKTTNLCKSFNGQTAVNNISLNIERNSVYGLLGPNGAGKSTSSEQIGIYIKALIDISRTIAGYQLHLEKFDIADYMGQIKAQASSLCLTKGICLQLETGANLGTLKADKLLLERAIMNVISNALDYSPPQETIYVTVQKTDCFLHISITDEGGGFTPEALHHAQEQFFMGDKSRTSNMHFGMGLYITSSIIKQHGGQLVLSNSKKTGGAQVIIKIPY